MMLINDFIESVLCATSQGFFQTHGFSVLISYFPQNSVDYAVLGATSKIAAILITYPFQVQLPVPLSSKGEGSRL